MLTWFHQAIFLFTISISTISALKEMHLLVTKGQTGRKSLKCLTKIIQTSKVSCFQDVVVFFFSIKCSVNI